MSIVPHELAQMKTLPLSDKKRVYLKALPAYEIGKPIMTDALFDTLEDLIRKEDPTWARLKKTGTKLKKAKTALPYYMPSLGKVYPEAADKWLAKWRSNLVVTDKLDGSSVMLEYEGGEPVRLITRGDGITGQDISFLLPYLRGIPKTIATKNRKTLRCEAVMKQRVFAKRYADEYDNPRNLVAGILNRSLKRGEEPDAAIKDIDVVVLGVYGQTYYTGLRWADSNQFNVVCRTETTGAKLNAAKLSKYLKARREASIYEMDGLVIADADVEFDYDEAEKPKWATAFKENLSEEDAPKTKVVDIIWQTSHNNRLIPKVQIEPVRLDGVKITYATVHNAQWMIERGIGPGAIIQIVRSGGVIPKITNVVKAARKMKLPDVKYVEKGVHFVATEESLESETKAIYRFLLKCGVETIALKTVTRMYDAGIIESYADCVRWASEYESSFADEMVTKADFTYNTAVRFHKELASKLKSIDVNAAMIGSGSFAEGVGERRLEQINKVISTGQLLQMSKELSVAEVAEALAQVDGIGDVVGRQIAEGVKTFRRLHLPHLQKYAEIVIPERLSKPKKPKKGKWNGQRATWTGYRSKEQEEQFVANGGEIVSFGSKTTVLFYKEGGKTSSKVEKAEAKGITVTTWENFA